MFQPPSGKAGAKKAVKGGGGGKGAGAKGSKADVAAEPVLSVSYLFTVHVDTRRLIY
jgi:hypothetical protein